MNASHDSGKYTMKNKSLVQGQVIGDHAQVHMHFSSSQKVDHDQVAKAGSLSFQKNSELGEHLLACACMKSRESRETVLDRLHEQFPGMAIARRPDNRADVMEIVSTCLKHAGSLAVLVDIVCYFEGETSVHRPMHLH